MCPDNARSDDPTLANPASLLVATTNADKLREIRSLLTDLPIELVTLARWPDLPPPEETGRTFAENARLKARYYAAPTGLLTVAEDSGLEIDALGGAPGVHSARFGGTDTSYAQKFALIYERLKNAGPPGGSSARFICALALTKGDAVLFESHVAGGLDRRARLRAHAPSVPSLRDGRRGLAGPQESYAPGGRPMAGIRLTPGVGRGLRR